MTGLLRLRRIHLRSVGPAAARFDPLDLDLTASGDAADRVLLELTNTGGKSSLIKLATFVVNPAARDQVAGANIGEYVDATDTAHVVLEWDDGGVAVVIGVVMEWKGRQRPAGAPISELTRLFYCFRPTDTTGVTDLPFDAADGSGTVRRRTLSDYRSAVEDRLRSDPAARLVWATTQAKWAETLETHTSLDPALFRYQMRMNDAEAGAGSLVDQLTTAGDVVQFFIRALNDDGALEDLMRTLTEYATAAGQRGDWQTELAFCIDLQQGLQLLAEGHTGVTARRDAAALADLAVQELAGRLDTRLRDDREQLAASRERTVALREQHQGLVTELSRLGRQRDQLAFELARVRAAAARADLADAETVHAAARRQRDAWHAVPVVLQADAADARLAAAQTAYTQAEGELSPLRHAAEAAGADLAAKWKDLADQADRVQRDVQAQIARLDAEDDQSRRTEAAHRATVRSLDQQSAAARATVTAAADAVAALRSDDVLDADTTAAAAAVDAEQQHITATGALNQSRALLQQDKENLQRATARHRDTLTAAASAASAHAAAASSLAEYTTQRSTLGNDPDVAEVAAAAPGPDVVADPDHAAALAVLAAERAGLIEAQAADARHRRDTVDRELAALAGDSLLSAADDVTAVLDVLLDAGVGAVTAMKWLAVNVPDPQTRRSWITTRPDLANAVVVSDPTRVDVARQAVTAADVAGRIAVLVTNSRAFDTDTEALAAGFVVEPRRAMFDPQWAADETDRLTGERDRLDTVITTATAGADAARTAASALGGFARRWPGTAAEDLPAAVERTAATVQQCDADVGQADADVTGAAAQVNVRQTAVDNASEAVHSLELRLARLRPVAEAEARAAEAEARAAAWAGQIAELTAALAELDTAAAQRQQQRSAAVSAAAEARHAGERYRQEQTQVGYPAAATVPAATLQALQARFHELARTLADAESGSSHAADLDAAQRQAAAAHAALDAVDPTVLPAATSLAPTLQAATPASRQAAAADAQERYDQAVAQVTTARSMLQTAETTLAERTPTDRQAHAQLPAEWDLGSEQAISGHLAQVTARTTAASTAQADVAGQLERQAAAETRLDVDLARLGSTRALHRGEATPGMPRYPGSPQQAAEAMTAAVDSAAKAAGLLAVAEQVERDAFDLVRAVASDPAWTGLDSPLRERCRTSPAADLVTHAAAWVTSLEARRVSLVDDIAQLDAHRDLVVGQLEVACTTQRRLLREVTSRSKMPAGSGSLEGQPTVRIEFDSRPQAEAHARLAERVDGWAVQIAADPTRASRAEQRLRWLYEATCDTVKQRPQAGHWSVRVIKPTIDATVEYRTPDRIKAEFSGGQGLTLAIVVYCALSAVRAANRTGRPRPTGTLLLDNPFGASSNAALIAMQQQLAAALDIQLVCLTGLNDPDVLAAFEGEGSVLLRLRNDRDQRRGLKYLRVDDPVVADRVRAAVAAGHGLDDDRGWLSATGYQVGAR